MEANNGSPKITIGATGHMRDETIGASMGLTTWAAFSGSDQLAAMDGDFIMRADEVQPVLRALRKSGIHIVALHNHMIGTRPDFYFTHFWGKGKAVDLARGFRAALDAQAGSRSIDSAGCLLPWLSRHKLPATRPADKPWQEPDSSRRHHSLVLVLVMDVRVMRVAVGQRRVGVLVGMRFAAVPIEIVRVLMVFVVYVAVRMGDRLMGVQVLVTLGQMQPYARAHQAGGQPEHP